MSLTLTLAVLRSCWNRDLYPFPPLSHTHSLTSVYLRKHWCNVHCLRTGLTIIHCMYTSDGQRWFCLYLHCWVIPICCLCLLWIHACLCCLDRTANVMTYSKILLSVSQILFFRVSDLRVVCTMSMFSYVILAMFLSCSMFGFPVSEITSPTKLLILCMYSENEVV